MSTPLVEEESASTGKSSSRKHSRESLRLNHRWFHVEVVAATLAYFAILYPLLQWNPVVGLMCVLVGAMIGLMVTMVAMAWGVAIAFAGDARSGLWFVAFPPYMVIFAIRHWSVMSQPSVLFLAGLLWSFGSVALGYACASVR